MIYELWWKHVENEHTYIDYTIYSVAVQGTYKLQIHCFCPFQTDTIDKFTL